MADFLTEKRQEIDNRLKELRPSYEEYLKLERAKEALAGMDAPSRRGPGRPRGTTPGNGRRRRRGRRGGGAWAEQALGVVRQNPGVTVSEIGDKLGVKQKNYLYRVMNNLAADGTVRKQGKGYHAA